MERNNFLDFLSEYKDKKLVIASHTKMDVDGLASAYTLSLLLPNSVISYTDKLNYGAELLAKKLEIKTVSVDSVDKKYPMLIVDTSSSALLPAAKKAKIVAIIDHHQQEGRDLKAPLMLIDTDAASTAEIIESLVPEDFWKTENGKKAAYALSVAIIADGARFKSARQNSFAALARLMNICKVDYTELLSFAEPEPREETKVAMLKAFQRVEYVYTAGYLIATSEVGSNESDAASLIAEAADVAFVASWKDKERETRVSARGKASVKVPLNEIMKAVAEELGGDGGGHKKAAGAFIKAHTKEALEKCVEIFIRKAGG